MRCRLLSDPQNFQIITMQLKLKINEWTGALYRHWAQRPHTNQNNEWLMTWQSICNACHDELHFIIHIPHLQCSIPVMGMILCWRLCRMPWRVRKQMVLYLMHLLTSVITLTHPVKKAPFKRPTITYASPSCIWLANPNPSYLVGDWGYNIIMQLQQNVIATEYKNKKK